MDFCFNDLCLKKKFVSVRVTDEMVIQWLCDLVDILKTAKEVDKEVPRLRTENSLWGLQIEGIPIMDCLQRIGDRDVRNYLLTIVNKSPHIEDAEFETFLFQGEEAAGLSAAWHLDCPAISFLTNDCWNKSLLAIDTINSNSKFTKKVMNLTNKCRFNDLYKYYLSEDHCLQYIKKFDDFKRLKQRYWKNLVFSDEIESDSVFVEISYLRDVVRWICQLNIFFRNAECNFHNLHLYIPNVSTESQSVKTNPTLTSQREFHFGGDLKICLLHIKIRDIRIHFYPDYENRKGYVGYIGKHLDTAKYK